MFKIVNGVEVPLDANDLKEIAEREAAWELEKSNVLAAPTKEQLMAELAALTAKIQALE